MKDLAKPLDDGSALDFAAEIRAFESGNIDGKFDHEAHVRLAWCYLQQFPAAETLARFTSALRALTERLGMPEKYHETITWFFIVVIANRIARSTSHNWEGFRTENSDLIRNGATLLRRHYSADHLNSRDARERFVLPDLCTAQTPGTDYS